MSAIPLRWRKLEPGELDHERLWLAVSAASGSLGLLAIQTGARTPPCLFHWATGWPCPGCGSTRALRQFVHGHLGAAFVFNPLATVAYLGVVSFLLYASVVLVGRLPRLRLAPLSSRAANRWRAASLVAVAANWCWVIACLPR